MYPILFRIGRFPVPSYALVVLAAMLVAYALVPRSARRNGVDPDAATTTYFVVVLAGILGARLLHVLLSIPELMRNPHYGWTILVSGGVWYGGILAGLVAGAVCARRFHVPYPVLVDTAAMPVVVGGGLGRMACFLSGCCYGSPTSLPWAVTFTDPIAHRLHADLPDVPIHPVQLYELFGALGIAVILDRLAGTPHRPGTIALVWIVLYGMLRVAVEFFRGDAVRGSLFGVASTSQVIGIATIAVALAILVRRRATA
jgi:phosphatidylglycerol---prolipoprotein diacylglyceryl transferase